MSETPLLALNHISKSFGGVQALTDVSLDVAPGEVHAIVGENGAGKSTMMKIIAGALLPTTGTLALAGQPVNFRTPHAAAAAGIAIVYQEPTFFRELSVIENIYLGDELRTKWGDLDWARMTAGAAVALERLGMSAAILGKPLLELSIGTQQLVLIARSIHKQARLLILDEPTAILSKSETGILFRSIRELKARGVSVLYISHRIAEIFQIADRISVLRDGRLVAQYAVADASEDKLVAAMTGRQLGADVYVPRPFATHAPLLEVKHLQRAGYYQDVSFTLRPGEVLGMYGLVGAGRSEVAQAIGGEMRPDSGTIMVRGQPIAPRSSHAASRFGIIYVPEDRRQQGLFPIRATRDNLSAGMLRAIATAGGIIRPQQEMALAHKAMRDLSIKASSPLAPVSSLSGGNQQKVLLGRGLSHGPAVLLLDEPTHGIDVGTKSEIHKLIMALAGQGISILMISSDLPEILALADNVLVMHEGNVTDYLPRAEASEERILRAALGLATPNAVPAGTPALG